MSNYWVKTPKWLKRCFPQSIHWDMPQGNEPVVYLTFDDGPHPTITPFVLNQLAETGSKATFFCVGNNVELYPETYQQVLNEGHTTGNHTFDHLNGWHTNNFTYLKNIAMAATRIENRIFRPPYGRIKLSQARKLIQAQHSWQIYMWDILSGDFDKMITAEQCTNNVISNLQPGSIVVFHDSEKAFERLRYTLPEVIKYCQLKGWQLKSLPNNVH